MGIRLAGVSNASDRTKTSRAWASEAVHAGREAHPLLVAEARLDQEWTSGVRLTVGNK